MDAHYGEFGRIIANDELRLDAIPEASAEVFEIERFALTFDGYQYWGSTRKCAEIANARRHDDLTDLRTCLFFEQRRLHHFGGPADEETMAYLRDLIVKIRAAVADATDQAAG